MIIIAADKSRFANILNNRWVQHISYWIFYLLFFAVTWGSYDMNFEKTMMVELVNLPAKIALVYWVIYYLFPKFLYKRQIGKFILLFGISLIVVAFTTRFTDNYIILKYYLKEFETQPLFSYVQIIRSSINLGTVIAIPFILKLVDHVNRVQQNEQLLVREKLEAELVFLKNQVQPHFLFNTLNSLYSLILKKSDQSLDVILKLSELLRYMLYETNSKSVDLTKEIDSIKSYLELEKIRYGDRIDLSFNLWGDLGSNQIAPMLILPFIENSFKHSTKGFDGNAWITIDLGITNNELKLKIENSVPQSSSDQESIIGGIGLQNVKRRLSLLYADKYELKITDNEDSYSINLNLQLQ
ncbi:sensor histidine kinase [Marinifilum caeruleilacunae]|uniref:Sensor histidine kinase n=1 Tax=Marinifilum caeruleilacunae TaxID=2499076 RepID=A0ABX1WWB9_9BACT|nr:histidine kinase [Marinifilum caeruleilacunae]NOU60347.1 sensor histidine kinase [Marinifilum caeruleilacunae]